jgi:hypothetical protein
MAASRGERSPNRASRLLFARHIRPILRNRLETGTVALSGFLRIARKVLMIHDSADSIALIQHPSGENRKHRAALNHIDRQWQLLVFASLHFEGWGSTHPKKRNPATHHAFAGLKAAGA